MGAFLHHLATVSSPSEYMSTPQSIRLARFPKKGKLNGKNIAAGKGARSEVSVRADDSLNRTSGVNAGCVDERTEVARRRRSVMRQRALSRVVQGAPLLFKILFDIISLRIRFFRFPLYYLNTLIFFLLFHQPLIV